MCVETFYEYSQSIPIAPGSLNVKWFFVGLLLTS